MTQTRVLSGCRPLASGSVAPAAPSHTITTRGRVRTPPLCRGKARAMPSRTVGSAPSLLRPDQTVRGLPLEAGGCGGTFPFAPFRWVWCLNPQALRQEGRQAGTSRRAAVFPPSGLAAASPARAVSRSLCLLLKDRAARARGTEATRASVCEVARGSPCLFSAATRTGGRGAINTTGHRR